MTPLTFDKQGRAYYHPDFHNKHCRPWTTSDIRFLAENYYLLGPEECSLHLERTIKAVQQRALELRKSGAMVRPDKIKTHKRTLRND